MTRRLVKMEDEKSKTSPQATAKVSNIIRVLNNTAEKTKELLHENSIIGDEINADGITVFPVSKLSIGFAGGGSDSSSDKKKNQPAGAGAKVSLTPVSFLIIKDGEVKLISATEPEKGLASVASGIVNKAGDLFKLRKNKNNKQ